MNDPVCVECGRLMKSHKTGVYAIQTVEGNDYKVWKADIVACPECGFKALSRFGDEPLKTRDEENFDEFLENLMADLIENVDYFRFVW